jgi:hypothetical protein
MNPQISTKSSPLRTLDSNDGSESQLPIGFLGFFPIKLRLGAQSFTLLNKLRDPTQLIRRQWETRQQHLFFGCPLWSSLEQLISAPNHE